ncbi:MAG: electron transport complex subunit RsxE [Candidatus Auribacter fodinae]|jgi:Na+-transporting NADH:ubiquinone oxidoreductase subunit D|uniref:Electron transport complex subunit RsxE n=1 Tax=Candidatus Auribacter fodinae TaxID=2093366 RepID=A0A3A4R7Q0_9BACT|nr:MAG: electron transport complex subunit RsxE [Candidatus Auribacter fodinae]
MASEASTRTIMVKGLWKDNPIFRQVLGICSTLAVTNLVLNTMVMCIALVFTTALSSFTVSLLRNHTPRRIRMMVQTLIIAFYVILVDIGLKAFWPEMSENLGPYVGLIITNCIVMGRCEAFAGSNSPVPSFIDGFYSGVGYSFILVIIAFFRELLGMGTLFGYPMPFFSTIWDKWIIMVMPPGAFFALALVIWLFRTISADSEEDSK